MPAKKQNKKTTRQKTSKASSKKTTQSITRKVSKKIQPEIVYLENPFSLKLFLEFLYKNFSLIFMLLVMFIAGFIIGSMLEENKIYRNGLQLGQKGPTAAVAGAATNSLEDMPKVTRNDHIIGKRNAKVVIVEYSDYECPFCSKFHPTMKNIIEEYGNKVAWVYRHYPLTFHQNAQLAAEVGECIAKYKNETAFWEYTDYIYENIANDPTITQKENLIKLAEQVGAKKSKIEKCIDTQEMAEKVKQDQEGGAKAGVGGTPAGIIVSKKGQYELINGAIPYEQVKTMVDKYL